MHSKPQEGRGAVIIKTVRLKGAKGEDEREALFDSGEAAGGNGGVASERGGGRSALPLRTGARTGVLKKIGPGGRNSAFAVEFCRLGDP